MRYIGNNWAINSGYNHYYGGGWKCFIGFGIITDADQGRIPFRVWFEIYLNRPLRIQLFNSGMWVYGGHFVDSRAWTGMTWDTVRLIWTKPISLAIGVQYEASPQRLPLARTADGEGSKP